MSRSSREINSIVGQQVWGQRRWARKKTKMKKRVKATDFRSWSRLACRLQGVAKGSRSFPYYRRDSGGRRDAGSSPPWERCRRREGMRRRIKAVDRTGDKRPEESTETGRQSLESSEWWRPDSPTRYLTDAKTFGAEGFVRSLPDGVLCFAVACK